jgi:hypothetical protein
MQLSRSWLAVPGADETWTCQVHHPVMIQKQQLHYNFASILVTAATVGLVCMAVVL